ncbi:MAG: hypothetical protein K6253_03015 [Candidatus Liberibacter asiaticus]|nr:hypothetical protein [Candidatus Liberibacter asiaticus]
MVKREKSVLKKKKQNLEKRGRRRIISSPLLREKILRSLFEWFSFL